jgi:aryl-alcohol dehydrogenase-like predicted oxidoreductase
MSTSTRTTTPTPQPEGFLARHRKLAPTAAVRVSPLCLSTRVFNQDKTLNQVGASDILDRFYCLGGNFIDTDHGQSERWVGDWMTARKNRDEIVLSSNYSNIWRPHEKSKWKSNFCGNNTKSMKVALEASLANLQTT